MFTLAGEMAGMVAVMEFADHAVMAAAVPPNWTLLPPWFAPKLAPVIVIVSPGTPEVGETPVIAGAVVLVTVNVVGLLEAVPTVTVMFATPGGRLGTMAVIAVGDQVRILALAEPNCTLFPL